MSWGKGAVACCSLRVNARKGKGGTKPLAGRNAVAVNNTNVSASIAISRSLPLSHFKLSFTPASAPFDSDSTSIADLFSSTRALCISDLSYIPILRWRPSLSRGEAAPPPLLLRGASLTACSSSQRQSQWSIESSLICQFVISPSTHWNPTLFLRFAAPRSCPFVRFLI